MLLWLIVAATGAFSYFVVAQRYWLDDSFITFRYFRNLFDGHGVVYNVGDAVEGYTNFLWGVVAWCGMHLGAEPIFFTQWVSLAAQAVSLLVVYRIGVAATGSQWRALLAPALLAAQIAFLTYPMTGMESAFFTMLVAVAFHLLNSEAHHRRGGAVGLGLTLVALGMTRFDGMVMVAILGSYWIFVRRDLLRLRLPLGIFGLGFVAFNAWRLSYFPTWLPNSFYAKISFSVARMGDGVGYVGEFLMGGQQLAFLLVLIALMQFRKSVTRSFLSWVVALQLVYVIAVGGDWMPHHRFIYHVLPLLFLLVQEGAWRVWDALRPRTNRPLLTGVVLMTALLAANGYPLYVGRDFDELSGDHFNAHEARRIGETLDRILPEDMLIGIEWGGIIPFYTRHEVLDTFGLTDRKITSLPFERRIWGRMINPAYIRSRGVDLLVPCARLFPTKQEAMAAVWHPKGICHYRYYPGMNSESGGYTLIAIEVGENAWWPALLRRGLTLASAGGADGSSSASSELADTRYQVSLFWGGGAARDWDGRFHLDAAPRSGFDLAWSWLTDFESQDRLASGAGFERPGNRPASGAAVLGAPPRGARILSATDGDADGICFEVVTAASTELVVEFPEASARWAMSELVERPRSVAVGTDGNVIHATAHALDASASLVAQHHGSLAHRVSLHDHSDVSTNDQPLASTVESLRPFVRRVWWTDHNMRSPRRILGGDFEDAGSVARYWRLKVRDARVLIAVRDADAREGQASYRLRAKGKASGAFVRIHTREAEQARQFHVPLDLAPKLRFSWKPIDGTLTVATVSLLPEGEIRYLSARPDNFDAGRDIVLEAEEGGWQDHRRDLRRDAASLGLAAGQLSLVGFSLGVRCPEAGVAEALFDDVSLEIPDPPELIREVITRLDRMEGLVSHVGMEQSGWMSATASGPLVPHFTLYVPGDVASLLPSADHALLPEERREHVAAIQAAGGCVGMHHVQHAEHYDALLAGAGYGVDLLEIGSHWWQPSFYATEAERAERDAHGYPALNEDDVFPVLVRWDRMQARGLLVTGYGAPDLNGLFDRPDAQSFNRWLSWIVSEDASQAGLLRALRSGRAVASEWRSDAIVTLDAGEGLGMGKLVVTDRGRQTVVARVSDAPPGSRLRWIVMPFARAQWDDATPEDPEPGRVAGEVVLQGGESSTPLVIDARRGGFVRAELRNPAGHLVALSNPVHVLPYWPERWPFGRVAFDWQGVRLLAEQGLLLDDARVDASGRLSLAGNVHAQKGVLRIGATSRPIGVDASAGAWSWDETTSAVVVEGLPAGRFDVTVAFETPLDPGQTADLLALPARKLLVEEILFGDPASETGRLISGFSKLRRPRVDHVDRSVVPPEATFRLAVPGDQPVWLKLQSGRGTAEDVLPFSGRLLMDGQEIGTLRHQDALTFALPPDLTAAASPTERTFTLELDPESGQSGPGALRLSRILLYAGPGVVDY